MPHQSKPGVDWQDIRARFDQGESASAIARTANVSKQAILKRAKREGWKHPNALATFDGSRWIDVATGLHELRGNPKAKPEMIAKALQAIQDGANYTVASSLIGINRETWRIWRNTCPALENACLEAQANNAMHALQSIKHAAANDWRAADRLLSANPLTRGDYANQSGAGGLTVTININRATQDEQARIVDIMPPQQIAARDTPNTPE